MRISYLFHIDCTCRVGIADILSGRGMVIQSSFNCPESCSFYSHADFRKQVGDDGWKQSVTDIAVTVLDYYRRCSDYSNLRRADLGDTFMKN